MNIPKTLKYTKSHEWVEFTNDTTAKVGLTDYAQNALGDLVFANLPEIGDEVVAEESFGDVESVKAVSDVFSPFTGEVTAVNEELLDTPEAINAHPYEAWFIEISDITEQEDLLSAQEYESFCEGL